MSQWLTAGSNIAELCTALLTQTAIQHTSESQVFGQPQCFKEGQMSTDSDKHPGCLLGGKMKNLLHKSMVQFKIQDDQQVEEVVSLLVHLGSLFQDC
jgi:hypothetical protein